MAANIVRELNLDALNKPPADWTNDEWQAIATLVELISKHLDLEDETLTLRVTAAAEAARRGRMPEAFYDEILQAAEQRHGGRMQ